MEKGFESLKKENENQKEENLLLKKQVESQKKDITILKTQNGIQTHTTTARPRLLSIEFREMKQTLSGD